MSGKINMPSKSKAKGNGYERELVDYFKQRGYETKRAWGSDGRSMGMEEDVDGYFIKDNVMWKFQAKRRKSIPKWINPGNSDMTIMRGDRGESFIVMKLITWDDNHPLGAGFNHKDTKKNG